MFRGCSIATFDYQRVIVIVIGNDSTLAHTWGFYQQGWGYKGDFCHRQYDIQNQN